MIPPLTLSPLASKPVVKVTDDSLNPLSKQFTETPACLQAAVIYFSIINWIIPHRDERNKTKKCVVDFDENDKLTVLMHLSDLLSSGSEGTFHVLHNTSALLVAHRVPLCNKSINQ